MNSKPYPAYKPSGVEWLGDVPEHWEVKKLKHVTNLFGRIGFRGYTTDDLVDEGKGAITLSPGNMKEGELNLEKCTYISWEKYYESPEIMIKRNDVVIVKTGSTFGKVSFVRDVDHPITLNPQIAVFKNISCNSRFFFFYVSSPYIQDQISLSNTGSTIPTMTQQTILSYAISLPPLSEQRAISAFLDRETRRIDGLIAKKKNLLSLLAEQRTALISRTVTKGLNPSVKLKPSGVEWLGDVPEHWEVKALRYLCRIETGDKDTVDAEDNGEYPFFVRSQTVERINSYTKNCEAVLTAGDGVGVGKVFHYVHGKFDFHQRVYMFSNFKKVAGKFFFLFFKENFWRVALEGGAKSTVDSLRRPMISNFPFIIPPLSEQQAIAAFLDRETAKIDTLSAKVQTAIERLKEYRTALISAAVTGKIDVREAV